MEHKYKITLFTPTYNRAYIIGVLYESLKRQTYKNFEWLIVDDGSTDNTQELVASWLKEDNGFDIHYYKKENGGKHTAINYSLDKIQGEIYVIVDSDDYLLDNGLERVAYWDEKYEDKDKIAGFVFRRCTKDGEPNGTTFEGESLKIPFSDNSRYNINGEKMLALYSDKLRAYRFPEFKTERFMTEAVLWNQFTEDGLDFLYINEVTVVMEYLEDGLTTQGLEILGDKNCKPTLFWKNPKGYAYWLLQESKLRNEGLRKRTKLYINYYCEMHDKISKKEIINNLRANPLYMNFLIAVYKLKNKIKHTGR